MFKLTKFVLLLSATVCLAASVPTKNITDADILPGQNVHWKADTTYIINGLVFVDSGATLTIDSGTVILAYQEAESSIPTTLVICRHGKIFANGTKSKPIIFSTDLDDPRVYNDAFDKDSWHADQKWGGVIILGNAPVNDPSGQKNVEGINPAIDKRGVYGGNDENDTSGVFQYVSIRHGGFLIAPDNEVNGLTMGGVGRGTKIEYVEVYQNSDDGFEWFGGTVNCRYLVSAFNADDAFDYDDGWCGRGQYWFCIQYGSGTADRDEAGEHDGGLSTGKISNPIISNCTYIGTGTNGLFDLRDNTAGRYFKLVACDFRRGILIDNGTNSNSAINNFLNGSLFIKQSMFWNIGDITSKNDWLKSGSVESLVQTNTIRDILINCGDTIKDPQFSSWSSGTDCVPDFNQYPAPPNFDIIDTSGEIGFDLRPKEGSPAILVLPENATKEEKQKYWMQETKEDLSRYIQPTAYIGAFSPWERPWYEGWTAVWNYGMAKWKIKNSTTTQQKPIIPPIDSIISNNTTLNRIPSANLNNIFIKNTKITFSTIDNKDVSVDLYNIAGIIVGKVFSGRVGPGNHSFNITNPALSNGYYICKVTLNNFSTSKLVLINK